MKTTLEIPDELYRRVKAQAALDKVKVKELVTEGLLLAMQQRMNRAPKPTPLEVMAAIRKRPLHTSAEVARIAELAQQARRDGWNQADKSA